SIFTLKRSATTSGITTEITVISFLYGSFCSAISIVLKLFWSQQSTGLCLSTNCQYSDHVCASCYLPSPCCCRRVKRIYSPLTSSYRSQPMSVPRPYQQIVRLPG